MAALREEKKLETYPESAVWSSGDPGRLSSGVWGGVQVGDILREARGELRTLGVRLEMALIALRSSCDLLAQEIFFSDKSLTRPMLERYSSGILPLRLRSVMLLALEDILDWFLLGSPEDICVLE